MTKYMSFKLLHLLFMFYCPAHISKNYQHAFALNCSVKSISYSAHIEIMPFTFKHPNVTYSSSSPLSELSLA